MHKSNVGLNFYLNLGRAACEVNPECGYLEMIVIDSSDAGIPFDIVPLFCFQNMSPL